MHFYGSSVEGTLLVIAMRHCLLGEKDKVALSEFCAHTAATVQRFQCIFITAWGRKVTKLIRLPFRNVVQSLSIDKLLTTYYWAHSVIYYGLAVQHDVTFHLYVSFKQQHSTFEKNYHGWDLDMLALKRVQINMLVMHWSYKQDALHKVARSVRECF